MINFPCHCGTALEVPQELAGGLIQCPKCGKLNDVPTLDDLAHMRPDGTYDLELLEEVEPSPPAGGTAAPRSSDRLDELHRFYGPKRDAQGNEVDLRPTAEEIARAGAPVTDDGLTRGAPKYDPETGELIRPLPVKTDIAAEAGPVPMAKAALTYSTDRVMHGLTAGRIMLELFMPVNVMVMAFIYLMHAAVQFLANWASRVISPVAFLLLLVSFPLVVLILAHYGAVVEDIGPDGRDDLPRPLRNVNLWDDLWGPFAKVIFALAVAFWPVLAVFFGDWAPPTLRGPLMWIFGFAGMIILPALLITTLTAGSVLNLRPDRVWGVMTASGGGYITAVVGTVLTCLLYLWNIFGLYLVSDATYNARPWLRHLDHPAITYSAMIMAVYFAHYLCWQLGVLYRRHHERFPWVLQRHTPTPRDARPAPRVVRPQPDTGRMG